MLRIGSDDLFVANNYINYTGQTTVSGVEILTSDGVIFANSIEGEASASSSNVNITTTGNLLFKDNILSSSSGSQLISIPNSLSNIDWDYNNYYTTGNTIANYNGDEL